MKITIFKDKKNPICRCAECGKEADLKANIGENATKAEIFLCFNCAWDLADILNETPKLSVKSIEKKNGIMTEE